MDATKYIMYLIEMYEYTYLYCCFYFESTTDYLTSTILRTSAIRERCVMSVNYLIYIALFRYYVLYSIVFRLCVWGWGKSLSSYAHLSRDILN